jgi:hypothetical protein
MRKQRKRTGSQAATELISEAEATVTGQLYDSCAYRQTVPGWVPLNALAHADWSTLTDLADNAWYRRRSEWSDAVMFLAREVLLATTSSDALLTFQRSALIPLELDVLADRSRAPSSAAELVSLVRRQLTHVRNQQSRPTVHRRPPSKAE